MITESTTRSMIAMTGFRVVLDQKLDTTIIQDIAEVHWRTLIHYCKELGVTVPLADSDSNKGSGLYNS